jgi:hypothetical protein
MSALAELWCTLKMTGKGTKKTAAMQSPSVAALTTNPIFVVGAVRSGTTMFRLMLDSHEDIANPGEVDFIFDYLHRDAESENWSCDIDKLLIDRIFQSYRLDIPKEQNGKDLARDFVGQFLCRTHKRFITLNIHRNLDKVAAIYSDAKVIHIIRDPRDVARSCIGMGWAGNTYFGVDLWLQAENDWDYSVARFDKNNVLEFHYENLILNTDEQLTNICTFIGVPFSRKMLSYPNHSTYESPDSSAVQQWKRRLNARDVALVEIKTKPLLLARNYELSGHPLYPPKFLESLFLICTNKIYKWHFACRRYGYFTFLMEKITRKFIRSRHHIFAQRINEISDRYAK